MSDKDIESVMQGLAMKDKDDMMALKLVHQGAVLGQMLLRDGMDLKEFSDEDALELIRKLFLRIYLKEKGHYEN